jgi:hypothetical protein
MLDTSEPITGVHLQLPRSGNEKNKREVDDVVALARIVLVDHAFVTHIGDTASRANLRGSLTALVAAVQVRTDWLWGCVGRSDDGYQSLEHRELGDVAAALAIAMQNPDTALTPGEVEDSSVAFLAHSWSAYSRDALTSFALQSSLISPNGHIGRLDEIATIEVHESKTAVQGPVALSSDAAAAHMLNGYLSKSGQSAAGRLRDGADIGLLDSDGLRVTHVVDTSISNIVVSLSSGSNRLRVLKLVTSERWNAANVRLNDAPVFSMQVGDELHILLPPFIATARLELNAVHSVARSYVFLNPLFGMMEWQNDISVFGPGSSR